MPHVIEQSCRLPPLACRIGPRRTAGYPDARQAHATRYANCAGVSPVDAWSNQFWCVSHSVGARIIDRRVSTTGAGPSLAAQTRWVTTDRVRATARNATRILRVHARWIAAANAIGATSPPAPSSAAARIDYHGGGGRRAAGLSGRATSPRGRIRTYGRGVRP